MPPPAHTPTKLALVMVGLPARGKTYMAQKLARYLRWLGHATRWFNVGNYRRERLGASQAHGFFDPANPEGRAARWAMARAAMDDMLEWLGSGGEIGIYDATNSIAERRAWVRKVCEERGIRVVFVESICDDPAVIEANIRATKLRSPDYVGVDPAEAVTDFRARIAHYEEAYEPVDETEGSFVKIIDVGRRVVAQDIQGFLAGKVVYFLMNLHITPRPIWLTRHGQSQDNLAGRVGGDSALSANGEAYAEALAEFYVDRGGGRVWTSTLRRTLQTAEPLGVSPRAWKALDEIDAGVCDGLTYAEIERRWPEEFRARAADKLRYRYPRGESYEDVIQRLEPVIIELERQQSPVLIIAHQAVLRCLYAYLTDHPPDEAPHLSIPLHTVIQLTPAAYGALEERFPLAPRVPHSSSST